MSGFKKVDVGVDDDGVLLYSVDGDEHERKLQHTNIFKKILTHSDLINLSTDESNTKELIPAQGDDTLIVPSMVIIGPLKGTPYTNVASTAISFLIGDDAPFSEDSLLNNVLTNGYIVSVAGYVFTHPDFIQVVDDINQPLIFNFSGGSGAFTGGDPENTVPITVIAEIIDTSG